MSYKSWKGQKKNYLGLETPPTKFASNTRAQELWDERANTLKQPGKGETFETHMADLDAKWRKVEGRKPFAELNAREKMLEGVGPWDPSKL